MNDQDKKLLELYLKDERKKKILFIIVAIIFVGVFLFYGYYAKIKQSSNEIDNSIQEETKNNIINEINTNEENASNIENTIIQETTESKNQVNEVTETTEEKQETIQKEESKKGETKEEIKENTQTSTASSENKEKNTKEKPANKDFLFTDGYTMDNVTQAAQDYLKSYDFSGECVPIKDNEGVYLGMRVIFY